MPQAYPSNNKNKKDWYQFVHSGEIGADVRPEIAQAWERCRAAGISPYLTATDKLTGEQLNKVLQRDKLLIEVAKPLIRHLHQFLAGAGFIVALCNRDGIMLHTEGDEDALAATHGNMVPGADWSEDGIGASSVGTTLYLDRPTQFWGFEHYCRMSQHWAGSGAPIHDPDGTLIGCLNISGSVEQSHIHTLGMVVITAQAISSQIKLEEAVCNVEKANQHQQTIINAMSEGILILDEDFIVVQANENIADRLNTSTHLLEGLPVEQICRNRNLLKIIRDYSETTDYIANLEFEGVCYGCTITCRVLTPKAGKSEILLLVNDILRAKRLAKRLSANGPLLTFQDIIGEDAKLRSAISLAKATVESSANVLILGESGTGKEVFAQAIHSGSAQADGPFVAINCAAIPKDLVTSTLFGYEEGAYTGAKRGGSPGKFELANRGTLFLDEIGELSLDIQAVLLRVLETKSFTRVGGKDNISVDVRIIAATNRDLLHECQAKRFRQDLYYRLNIFSIQLPPLRERRGDIPLLANHFLVRMNRRYKRKIEGFTEDALELFLQYDWPGNIRELQNAIERTVVICDGEKITKHLVTLALPTNAAHIVPESGPPNEAAVKGAQEEDEREKLLRLLEECKWNISKAAVRLGIARSTLYRKLYYYGLKDD